MPLQCVVERDALADKALAVIDQEPEIEFRPVQVGGRQVVQTLAQRRPGDGNRIDAVGLPAPARLATRVGHQLCRDAQDPLAACDQKPLERARDVPAVLQRPHPFGAQLTGPDDQGGEALGADCDGLLAHEFAGCRRDCGDRVRALVGVRTQHDH